MQDDVDDPRISDLRDTGAHFTPSITQIKGNFSFIFFLCPLLTGDVEECLLTV